MPEIRLRDQLGNNGCVTYVVNKSLCIQFIKRKVVSNVVSKLIVTSHKINKSTRSDQSQAETRELISQFFYYEKISRYHYLFYKYPCLYVFTNHNSALSDT